MTLNYTAFLQQKLGTANSVYFHGGLADYVRMDTRDLLPVDRPLECDPETFIRKIVMASTDFKSDDIAQQRHVIPALVPPLRLKPILSHRYIELWAKASKWVSEAAHIVVVGYSFNSADEHFNDILRNHSDRRIDIIAPEAATPAFRDRMEKVFRTSADQYTPIQINGLDGFQAKKIRLIGAKATDVDIAELFAKT
ncbi:hypothetical protein [Magnetospirillum sp. 15-1]|uniref:hypothetical protein n=1 Tax=Magnetospirillum sp. 15-1 TaxID=1979370 RepID=UPI000BBB748B|nr:hypothetical protein [Magnetospirillum sp. 15-1]